MDFQTGAGTGSEADLRGNDLVARAVRTPVVNPLRLGRAGRQRDHDCLFSHPATACVETMDTYEGTRRIRNGCNIRL